MKLLMFLSDVETCKACGGADVVRILKFIWTLLDIVLFAIPIGLILIVMIDFGKNVMAGKEDEMKKNLNIAIKRLIYAVVLFLVPTIVSFAISLVDEAVNIQALKCIELLDMDVADLNPILEQEGCAIDYENLSDEIDTTNEGCYECKDSDKEIYVWSYNIPNKDYKGCKSGYSKGARTKELCSVQPKQCWSCLDESGYVLSEFQPSGGFKYSSSNSFGYTSTACGAGFNSTPVDSCNCTKKGC